MPDPYTTPDDMAKLFGAEEMLHLSNLYDADATTVDNDRVTAAIAWAQDIIDSYIGGRYSLPLTTVPLVIGSAAADLARYQLDSLCPREDVRQRYDDRIKWLSQVCQGKLKLNLDENEEVAEEVSLGDVSVCAPEEVFGEVGLTGYAERSPDYRPRWLR